MSSNVKGSTGANMTLGDGTPITTGTDAPPPTPRKMIAIPCPAWETGTYQDQSTGSFGKVTTILCGGSVDTDFQTWTRLPADFTELVGYELDYMEDNGGPVSDVVWRLAAKKVVDLGLATGTGGSTTDTVQTVTGAGDTFHTMPLNKPDVPGLKAGDVIALRVERRALTDAADTCAQGMGFLQLALIYR